MRRRALVISLAAAAASTFALVACIDLFHSTKDILDACELDADLDACLPAPDAVPDGPIADAAVDAFDGNFCAFSSDEARIRADTACAWLGACETPLGQNRYATCVEHAILAYDCSTNPDMPVRGGALAFWECMLGANECGSVHDCAWGVNQPGCPGGMQVVNTVCDEVTTNVPLAPRGQCPNDDAAAQPHAENCGAWGQTCAYTQSAVAVCAGNSHGFDIDACAVATCNGTQLYQCDDAGDNIGVDCANYGKGECSGDGGFPTCVSTSTTPCSGLPIDNIACETINGASRYAIACPDGKNKQTVDCLALTEDAGACNGVFVPNSWDISSACFNAAAPIVTDTCVGGFIHSSDRGVTYTKACTAPFTGCAMVTTADGMRAACTLPSVDGGGNH